LPNKVPTKAIGIKGTTRHEYTRAEVFFFKAFGRHGRRSDMSIEFANSRADKIGSAEMTPVRSALTLELSYLVQDLVTGRTLVMVVPA
jgi:hypothetical protein